MISALLISMYSLFLSSNFILLSGISCRFTNGADLHLENTHLIRVIDQLKHYYVHIVKIDSRFNLKASITLRQMYFHLRVSIP